MLVPYTVRGLLLASLLCLAAVPMSVGEVPRRAEVLRTEPTDGDVSVRTPAPESPREVEIAPARASRPDEVGDRTLTLRLIDASTGRPRAGWVRLWQLDLPETEHWTAGDRIRDTVKLTESGTTLTNLPEGRYRVDASAQPLSQEAPPAFAVRGAHTFQDIAVRPARSTQLALTLLDVQGRVVQGRARLGVWDRFSEDEPPDWANPREEKEGGEFTHCDFDLEMSKVELGPEPLKLEVREPTRGRRGRWSCHLFPDGRSDVWILIDGDLEKPWPLVLPSVRESVLRQAIGAPADARILARATVTRDADWRDVPIEVHWANRTFVYTVRGGVRR